MGARRRYSSYNDGCAAAHALDLIGERWALIVVRELLLGPKRFGDLARDIRGIGPSALSQRLADLEDAGILRRATLAAPARVAVYALTEWGLELEAVNAALSAWGIGSPGLPWDADMSPDTLVLAMRAHARPAPKGNPRRTVALVLTDSRLDESDSVTYLATITPRGTSITRGTPAPDKKVHAVVTTSTRSWKAHVLSTGTDPEVDKNLAINGSAAAVRQLLDATRLHEAPTFRQ